MYLRADVALPMAYKKMEPNLFWLDFVTPKAEESNAFMYSYDSSGKSGDSKKKTPAPYTQGQRFPEVDKGRKLTAAELLESKGFSYRLPREVVRSNKLESETVECFDTLGFWMAEAINNDMATAITGGATTPTWAPTSEWSVTATATPVEDLRKFKYQMRREGYPFRLTDVVVDTTSFGELEGYLASIDVSATKQEKVFGMPGERGDSIYIPIAGANVTGLDSGITHGGILGADRNNPAAEIHYYVDPLFGTPKISYLTMQDGKAVTKTVPNIGLHYATYDEKDTHDTIVQMWYEAKTVVSKPYGLIYDTGI